MKLIDVILEKTRVYLVFEFLYMDLKKYIDDQKEQDSRIDKNLAISYSYQLCQVCPLFFGKELQLLRLLIFVIREE